jgi:hypothetical protein
VASRRLLGVRAMWPAQLEQGVAASLGDVLLRRVVDPEVVAILDRGRRPDRGAEERAQHMRSVKRGKGVAQQWTRGLCRELDDVERLRPAPPRHARRARGSKVADPVRDPERRLAVPRPLIRRPPEPASSVCPSGGASALERGSSAPRSRSWPSAASPDSRRKPSPFARGPARRPCIAGGHRGRRCWSTRWTRPSSRSRRPRPAICAGTFLRSWSRPKHCSGASRSRACWPPSSMRPSKTPAWRASTSS